MKLLVITSLKHKASKNLIKFLKFKKIDLTNTEWLYYRLVNVPSSPIF